MRALKSMNVNLTKFQKCGEIMVAVKQNKFAMACNFCQEMFSQLQSFMRHLQLQHNDKLEFRKEMEVYAVEELMNQTGVSCESGLESEGGGLVESTQCLKEDDINWLQNGTKPKKRECGKDINKTGESSDGLVNMSILKALEDCDVSLNFIDNLVTAKNAEGGEGNSKFSNALLGEVQGDLCSSDAIVESFSKVICNNMSEIENFSKNLDTTEGTVGSITMRGMPITCKGNEGNLNGTKDNFKKSIKGIKNLLGSLENLEDVDSLLKNLECSIVPENNLISEGKAEFKEMQHNSSLETAKQNLLTHTNPICEEEKFSTLNSTLKEDLTTVLADVLYNNEMDLLNIQQEDEAETSLNQELLNYLDQELMENEYEPTSNLIKEPYKPYTVKHSLKSSKKSRSSLMSANIKMKYQKTHLKAKSKLSGIKNKILLKTSKQILSKNPNLILIENAQNCIQKNERYPLKVLPQQKQYKCADEVSQSLDAKQTDSILNQENSRNGKISNQENNTPTVNINKYKEEILTPNLSLINLKRRKQISLKREQSPRTQKISEDISNNIMLKQGREISNKMYIKPSLEGLEKTENLNSQQITLRIGTQKTSSTKLRKLFKESFETLGKIQQENHLNKKPKTSQANYLPMQKDSKMQCDAQNKIEENESSRTQNFTKSNKSSSSLFPPKITVGNSTSNCHPIRFPSTTPQRVRNVTIKLSRVTSNKLIQKIRPQKAETLKQSTLYTSSYNTKSNISHLGGNFKLPEGITITRILPNTNMSEKNATKVDETSIKSGYYKQNFTESNLEASQYEILSNKKENIKENFKLRPQNEVLNNLKSESISYKLRQRKASIDTLPNSIEAIKTPRHYNMNYKSYAVSSCSVRKKEVSQRMRHIKNQILKSIENGECTIKKFNQAKSPLYIKNVQILPNLKTNTIPLISPFKDVKNPTKQLNDGKEAKNSLQNSNNDFPINLNEKLVKKSLRSATAMLNNENQAKRPFKPLRKVKNELIGKTSDLELTPNKLQIKSPLKEYNKLDQKSSKLIYRVNQNNKSPQKEEQNEMLQKNSELKATRLDLSENVNFLQCDLKANRLIDDIVPGETSLKSNASDTKNEYNHKGDHYTNNINIIDNLLQQVDNEKNINNTSETKDESSKFTSTFKDFNESKDIELLNHFGLKIIKIPNIEDIISLEELDVMHEKAQKFANIYKCFQRIWSAKYFPEISTNKKDLETSFHQLLSQINLAFDIPLSLVEIKRLVNLINMWYDHNFNSKLIEKKKISESANHYLLMFNYIPKTVRRSYFCEYCEEYFNTEHKYFTHRIKHTGASYPYICQKCFLGYKVFKSLKLHENICNMNESVKNIKPESTTNNYDTNFITKIRVFQCLVCSETFETSKLLYEHSKKHLKTVYNCVKCDLIFASAIDVRNHMTICNKGTKHVPRCYTPRSTKQKKN